MTNGIIGDLTADKIEVIVADEATLDYCEDTAKVVGVRVERASGLGKKCQDRHRIYCRLEDGSGWSSIPSLIHNLVNRKVTGYLVKKENQRFDDMSTNMILAPGTKIHHMYLTDGNGYPLVVIIDAFDLYASNNAVTYDCRIFSRDGSGSIVSEYLEIDDLNLYGAVVDVYEYREVKQNGK